MRFNFALVKYLEKHNHKLPTAIIFYSRTAIFFRVLYAATCDFFCLLSALLAASTKALLSSFILLSALVHCAQARLQGAALRLVFAR